MPSIVLEETNSDWFTIRCGIDLIQTMLRGRLRWAMFEEVFGSCYELHQPQTRVPYVYLSGTARQTYVLSAYSLHISLIVAIYAVSRKGLLFALTYRL